MKKQNASAPGGGHRADGYVRANPNYHVQKRQPVNPGALGRSFQSFGILIKSTTCRTDGTVSGAAGASAWRIHLQHVH
jgi:hypothetical protein